MCSTRAGSSAMSAGKGDVLLCDGLSGWWGRGRSTDPGHDVVARPGMWSVWYCYDPDDP